MTRRRIFGLACRVVLLVLFAATIAHAQDGETASEWSFEAIAGVIAAVLAAVSTLYARWASIPKDLPMPTRVARMLDLSQVFDSTRRLDDDDPNA